MEIGYIYKITSPKKRIYIGQTVNVKKRRSEYMRLKCQAQPRLYRSLSKYGWDKHKFEVIIECDRSDLNKWERYYQDIYSACSSHGLNCKLTDSGSRPAKHSEETKRKMGATRIKYLNDLKQKLGVDKLPIHENIRAALLKHARNQKPLSEAAIEHLRAINLGRKHTPETIQKLKIFRLKLVQERIKKGLPPVYNSGIPRSEETKRKVSETKRQRDYSGERSNKSLIYFNPNTGIYYFGCGEVYASLDTKYTFHTVREMMCKPHKNRTPIIKV